VVTDEGDLVKVTRTGRMLRVPVVNGPGAGEARRVHARLHFGSSRTGGGDREYFPKPTSAEWPEFGHDVEVDLPGNGLPRHINVVMLVRNNWPPAFAWTQESQEADLVGYGIWSNSFYVRIEVLGVGPQEPLTDTLQIRWSNHDVWADWLSGLGSDHGTNAAYWDWP
jgi:hypothetical protein